MHEIETLKAEIARLNRLLKEYTQLLADIETAAVRTRFNLAAARGCK